MTPLLLLFLSLHGVAATAVLVLCGALTVSSFSVTVVMTQELMARYQGMAAGLTTGFAIGMGGLGALIVGALADYFGLPTAFLLLSLLPLPAVGLTLLLPHAPGTAIRFGRHAKARA
jgi:FSR family fosmidomycin resistance protein-like MFS transporter